MDYRKIAENVVEGADRRNFLLAPGLEATIEATEDGIGFKLTVDGSFRSGDGIEDTIRKMQDAFKEISID